MAPTVGRELFHRHVGDLFYYQIIVYQGSLLVDALLDMVGFAVFGDHLFAWQSVSLFYVAGIVLAGGALLYQASGRAAAVGFSLLVAGSPFLVKDGLLACIGGHGSGLFFALLATALSLSAGRRPFGASGRAACGSHPRRGTAGLQLDWEPPQSVLRRTVPRL